MKYNQASSRLIVHWQKMFCFLFLGTEIQLNSMNLVSLPPFGSWMSSEMWKSDGILRMVLDSISWPVACLAVGPCLPCWAFSFSEQLWSEQQRFFFSPLTQRSWFNTGPEGTGPTCCSWASVCVSMLKSTLPAGPQVWMACSKRSGGGKPASSYSSINPDYQPQALTQGK